MDLHFNNLKLILLLIVVCYKIENIICDEKYNFTRNYCASELCNGRKHIACENTGNFAIECEKSAKMIEMTPSLIRDILHWINTKRDRVAKGELKGYEPAKRMPVLEWCEELAYLAELNVKRCTLKHDECRNTEQYPKVGQNIGIISSTGELPSHKQNIQFFIDEWFDEYKDADQTYIDSYHQHPGKQIGHFTALVLDRAQKVGCALCEYRDEKTKKNRSLFTCNFSATNFQNKPIYNKGNTASGCETGVDNDYKGLCTSKEKVLSVPKRERKKLSRKKRPKN